MASIRKLKKDVNHLAYEMLTEAYALKHYHPDLDEKKFDEIIKKIVKTRNDLLSRINNPDNSEKVDQLNDHFSKIKADMNGMIKVIDNLKQ